MVGLAGFHVQTRVRAGTVAGVMAVAAELSER
jgi:hypothetical protein